MGRGSHGNLNAYGASMSFPRDLHGTPMGVSREFLCKGSRGTPVGLPKKVNGVHHPHRQRSEILTANWVVGGGSSDGGVR